MNTAILRRSVLRKNIRTLAPAVSERPLPPRTHRALSEANDDIVLVRLHSRHAYPVDPHVYVSKPRSEPTLEEGGYCADSLFRGGQ